MASCAAPAPTAVKIPHPVITHITKNCLQHSGQPMTSETLTSIREICTTAFSEMSKTYQLSGQRFSKEEKTFTQIIRNNLSIMDKLIQQACQPYFPPQLISMATMIATDEVPVSQKLDTDVTLYKTASKKPCFVGKTPPLENVLMQETEALFCIPPHKNIVPFAGVRTNEDKTELFLNYGGDDLHRIMNPDTPETPETPGKCFSSQELYTIALELVTALVHLHTHHFLHRDIKRENVLQNNEDTIQLADFGFAHHLPEGTTSTGALPLYGTYDFFSPEQMKQVTSEEVEGKTFYFIPYSEKTDVWALGCTLFELLCNQSLLDALNSPITPPKQGIDNPAFKKQVITTITKAFTQENIQDTINRLIEETIDSVFAQELKSLHPQQLANIIKYCLCVDPEKRLSAQDIQKKLA